MTDSSEIVEVCKSSLLDDPVYQKAIENIDGQRYFKLQDGLLWKTDETGKMTICIPRKAMIGRRKVIEVIMTDAHRILGHLGKERTGKYIRSQFWW
ncbi:hypothetical protein SISNIDRAFT_411093, partial [Sistotremastrum niveocremeum HHB9708]